MNAPLFGAHFFHTNSPAVFEPGAEQLYFFRTYIGSHTITVAQGDCVYFFDEALTNALVMKGPCTVESHHLATVIRGYMHPNGSTALEGATTLPYVNGCSTKQLFPPLRPGDPTLQYLHMPPCSKEQAHHIHSTYRVVLILKGSGTSIVGMESQHASTPLAPGTVCILEPMCPHHFETSSEAPLVALPLHVYSSTGPQEKNHPMFNGTIMI